MGKNYSVDVAEAINRFLGDDDWRFSFDEEKGKFRFGLSLDGKLKEINYIVDVKQDEVVFYAISPIGADSEDEVMLNNMAKFICRANYGLKNGCFELDVNDGEIRYRSYIDCDSVLPSQAVIKDSIYVTAKMFDRYAPGIIAVIFQDATGKEAIDLCEKPAEDLRSLRAELRNSGNGDVEALLARLAARIGGTDGQGDTHDVADNGSTNTAVTTSEESDA